ncbi:MAG: flagellar hook-associated protein FlgK [Desulfovibrionales bacterium]
MPGLSSILNTGQWALFASQASIEVTGNNIANVNTPGYSRQAVRLEEAPTLDFAPGQLGTGVRAKEVIRYFDELVEAQYNDKASLRERWSALETELGDVEMIFNEADGGKINEMLSQFWAHWQALSLRPNDITARSTLVQKATDLAVTVNATKRDLETIQNGMDARINDDVKAINDLIKRITELNREITIHQVDGQNNANSMLDERARLVRDLSAKIDIQTIDNGAGNFTVLTKAGHTLVDGMDPDNVFELRFNAPQTVNDLSDESVFDGRIYYEGESDYEYLVEVVDEGDVGAGATFKVSIDDGKTWLKDEDGKDREFQAGEYDQRVLLPEGGLSLWFGRDNDAINGPTTELSEGDRFTVMPKSGLYWYKNSSSEMNVTPLLEAGGIEDSSRVTGGTLAGYFQARDHHIAHYREKLDTFAEGLAWEVNRLHSQGAGLSRFTEVTGTNGVTDTSAALGEPSSGLNFGDKLQKGGVTIHVFDSNTGSVESEILDFDPENDSLDDLITNIDYFDGISASLSGNTLKISASESRYEFAFGSDSTGVLAALGINSFFDGTDASTLEVGSKVRDDLDFVAAGHVNGSGEMNQGDNTTARAIAGLATTRVDLSTAFEGATSQTLSDYFGSIVGNVGGDKAMAKFNHMYNKSLADDLNAKQEEVAGVNLDEEMSNLIKFQHSYTAAAKMILAADRMLETLMSVKQ